MYIMNERSGSIVDSAFVSEFFLSKTNDSTLISARWHGVEKPFTLERYADRKEAMGVLHAMLQALTLQETVFYLPDSMYYFQESVKKDARMKRKGGS